MTTFYYRMFMPTLLALLLSLCGCRGRPAPVSSPTIPTPASTSEAEPADIFAPFPVASQLQIPIPGHLLIGGYAARGSFAGPVNTEEPDRDFFTAPEFDREGNTGRLFASQSILSKPYETTSPDRSVAFICWQPIAADHATTQKPTMMAQLLPWRDGYTVSELTTDGKGLFVHFVPESGPEKSKEPVDRYVWKGDPTGHGRFVPEGNKPFPAPPAPVTLSDAEEAREEGFRAIHAHQYDDAIEAFQKAVALRPDDARAYYGLGLAYIGNGQPAGSDEGKKAVAAFSRAIERDPKYIEAWRERAEQYWVEAKFDKAVADATRVIALEPKKASGYVRRAQYHADAGAIEKAAADMQTAVRLGPEETEYQEALAQYLYQAGRYPEAIRSAQQALDRDDTLNVARVVLACIYARQGQTDKALRQIQAARDNGITYDQRRDGLRAVKRALAAKPDSAALKALYQTLSGPDQLEPSED